MGKKANIYIVISVVTLIVLMLLQYNKPKEINWFPTFVSQHKIPFGTYVLKDVMGKIFQDKAQQVNVPPFEFLNQEVEASGTYFFVNDKVEFGEAELNTLLDWTSKGNTLFIASAGFEEQLTDTLHLKTSSLYADFGDEQKQRHRLTNPQLKTEDGYIFDKDNYSLFFKSIDTINTKIVGLVSTISKNDSLSKEQYNVIKQPFGKGQIILSTFPKAFTNYFILKDNNKNYTAGLLSYVDSSQNIYIDNHYKSGKSFYTSPMYIFLNTKEFKWAYYLALFGALIYVVFEGKRKQRAIPIVAPLQNQTLAFTRTIADMYFEKGEQKSIIEHKIAYFLEYIRTHFYLSTLKQNDVFYQHLAMRSNHTKEEVKILFSYMEQLSTSIEPTDESLKKLNSLIEKFKARANGK
ncbi:DUF4350 domain-containing protein [Kriegella aquimaris]|uniref:DUF4350 domain-containing protein n=1 Tax=Kriegella aquimaris TaxID=192904 RepID=A0A1G9WBD0_9FLAO|nr:DUF4350 domain-containing protein [Kriegella aquimaris]SDM81812.1 protein of unknown function [Kriegella aquimaris]